MNLPQIKVQCQCGHRSAARQCSDQTSDYQRLQLSSIMNNLGTGSSIDLADIMGSGSGRGAAKSRSGNPRVLECNEECANIDRNRRLALALQIENPDRDNILRTPPYSEFMKDFARRELSLTNKIHDELTKLVKLAKEVSSHQSAIFCVCVPSSTRVPSNNVWIARNEAHR